MFDQKTIDRFWNKVDRTSNPNCCWEWTANKLKQRYGRFSIGKKHILAHRFSYELHYGKIPDGLDVLHTCDNPPCVNPNHLYLGTQQDNANDMVAKNRQAKGIFQGTHTHPESVARGDKSGYRLHPEKYPRGDKHYLRLHPEKASRGEQNGWSKFTNEQILEIRKKYIPWKYSTTKLAKEYKTSPANIWLIVSRKHWKHI